jgi:hypothetical protein
MGPPSGGDAHRGGLGEVEGGVYGIALQKVWLQGRPHGRGRDLIGTGLEGDATTGGLLCTAIEGER